MKRDHLVPRKKRRRYSEPELKSAYFRSCVRCRYRTQKTDKAGAVHDCCSHRGIDDWYISKQIMTDFLKTSYTMYSPSWCPLRVGDWDLYNGKLPKGAKPRLTFTKIQDSKKYKKKCSVRDSDFNMLVDVFYRK